MKKNVIIFVLIVFIPYLVTSQTSKPVFHIGGAVNYYYGNDNGNGEELEFNKTRLSFEIDAALGIQTLNKKVKPKNTFALFGKLGFISDEILTHQLHDQDLDFDIDTEREFADFQELEVGVIVQQAFRISFGYGWLNFYDTKHKPQTLEYYAATSGFSIPFRSVIWNINVTAMGGKDFYNITFRPSTGLIIQLD